MTKRWNCHAALLVVMLSGFAGCRGVDELHSPARQAWKDDALARIAARADDADWCQREQIRLASTEAHSLGGSERWLSDQLILLGNGDWLIYTNVCRKQPGHIYDLFLAKGSDGQWYYSTYHFCSGMIVLREEDQAATLTDFARTYSLKPFDGHSDECLAPTWPTPK